MCGGSDDGPTYTTKKNNVGLNIVHIQTFADGKLHREQVKDKLAQGSFCCWPRSPYSRPITDADVDITQLKLSGSLAESAQNLIEDRRTYMKAQKIQASSSAGNKQ